MLSGAAAPGPAAAPRCVGGGRALAGCGVRVTRCRACDAVCRPTVARRPSSFRLSADRDTPSTAPTITGSPVLRGGARVLAFRRRENIGENIYQEPATNAEKRSDSSSCV